MVTAEQRTDAVAWAVKDVPITSQHPPALHAASKIKHPEIPRATQAVSAEKPQGSATTARSNLTVLQQHVAFFDRDGDGVIYPWDTYVGFRRVGFGMIISALAVPVIHGTFSYPTSPTWIPDIRLPIHMKNMHRTKHGSDSETYDTEGRFNPAKFEEIFSKFDKSNKGALSWSDIQEMVHSNMNVMDPTGWIAERLEWWTLYLLCHDQNGLVSKEKIRSCYDGTLWDLLAAQHEAKRTGAGSGTHDNGEHSWSAAAAPGRNTTDAAAAAAPATASTAASKYD